MKIKLFLILFIGLTIDCYSQIAFQNHFITDQNYLLSSPESVFAADIDGDGDIDLLSASSSDDKIVWYENMDGLGRFGLPKVITLKAEGASFVYVADIDGDGDMDVISASLFNNDIAWYENTDGQGNFSAQKIISQNANNARSVYAADIDGDGDMDVVSASSADGKIAWYKNTDGKGSFGTQQIISTAGAYSVSAADMDGDGDMDVLSASAWDNKIAWYENTDGKGNFGLQHVITTQAEWAYSVYASDIDGDGDMDVLSASFVDDKIAWYENTDGKGNFGSQKIITRSADGAESVYAADIDGDGDIDVLSASSFDKKIAWYENTDGKGLFGSQQIITTNAGEAVSVFAADFNGDGDIDVLSNTFDDLAWYENTDGLGSFGEQKFVIPTASSARSVYATDIDGDGYLDLLSASDGDNKVAWYKNTDGRGSFGEQQVISTALDDASFIYAADIDGDGDKDVIAASVLASTQIAWFENTDGLGNFGLKQVIDSPFSLNCVYAADIDGDGDIDILSASMFGNEIAWYENTDGLGNFGSKQIITYSAGYARSVYAADIDGDGDIDVLSASERDNKIAWYENTDGKGSFGFQEIISTQADDANSVFVADIDGDGDMDVISGSYGDHKIAWYENTDGSGTFGPQQVITTLTSGAIFIYSTDLDNDGDLDILSASPLDDKIAWYENTDGLGSFGTQQVISNIAIGAVSIYAADINNDGDMDVLSASFSDDKIAWYENLNTILSIDEFETTHLSVYPNPTTDRLYIKSDTNITNITLYNELGQIVMENANINSIDFSNLKRGLYFLLLKDENGLFQTKKIIKE